MAKKTISIDLEAYERLRLAKRARSESFSMVIKRAVWPAPPTTAGALLEALERAAVLSDAALARLEGVHAADTQPGDPWRDS